MHFNLHFLTNGNKSGSIAINLIYVELYVDDDVSLFVH